MDLFYFVIENYYITETAIYDQFLSVFWSSLDPIFSREEQKNERTWVETIVRIIHHKGKHFVLISNIIALSYIILIRIFYIPYFDRFLMFCNESWNNRNTINEDDWNQNQTDLKL